MGDGMFYRGERIGFKAFWEVSNFMFSFMISVQTFRRFPYRLAYHLQPSRVPQVVHVPQVENHCLMQYPLE